jgi:hypothetical protein
LNDFSRIEVPAEELPVGLVLLKCHDGKMVLCENRMADGGNSGEDLPGSLSAGAWQRLDEPDVGRRM